MCVCPRSMHISPGHLLFPSEVLSAPVRVHLTDMSGLHSEPKQNIRGHFICSRINILWWVSWSVVYIVALVGFLNTSQLFGAQTCFGKFWARL